jgi:D-3-phosphoglycerate dehydrogenase / 2-oxoglutarate reductase
MSRTVLTFCDVRLTEPHERLLQSHQLKIEAFSEDLMRSKTTQNVYALVLRSGVSLDKNLIDRFENLALVVRAGSGLDNIDLEHLKSRGISLIRNAAISAPAVAELALSAFISLARRLPFAEKSLLSNNWVKSKVLGEPLSELSITIWGAGCVGKACYKILKPMVKCVNFLAHSSVSPDFDTVDVQSALRSSDGHIICVPLSAGTVIGKNELAICADKRPYLINVARFESISWKNVVRMLEEDKLRGVYVDPIDREHMDEVVAFLKRTIPVNLMCSPHLGAQREDIVADMANWIVKTLTSWKHDSQE